MSALSDKIFKNVGIHVHLKSEEDFMVIRETLTRIGVSPKNQKKLYQSCHILRKNDVYVIAHFKELFLLDNLTSTLTEDDRLRRNAIVDLLEQWNLVTVDHEDEFKMQDIMDTKGLKVIKHSEKDEWELVPKFNVRTLKNFLES